MRLIDADMLLKATRRGKVLYFDDTATDGYTDVLLAKDVECTPTIEAENVRHGKWIEEEGLFLQFHCSVCGEKALYSENHLDNITEYYLTDYCPHCGAKMEGEHK